MIQGNDVQKWKSTIFEPEKDRPVFSTFPANNHDLKVIPSTSNKSGGDKLQVNLDMIEGQNEKSPNSRTSICTLIRWQC